MVELVPILSAIGGIVACQDDNEVEVVSRKSRLLIGGDVVQGYSGDVIDIIKRGGDTVDCCATSKESF